MRQISFFASTILIVTLMACGQSGQKEEQADVPADWKTASRSEFSIQFPDSLELDTTGQMGTSLILFSKTTSADDPFRENVNVMIQNLAGQKIDLNKYVEISEGQIKTMITNGALNESKRVKEGDSEYHRIVYSGKQGEYDLKWLQYYWVVKDKAFVVTLTCEKNQYDRFVGVGEKVLKSFRVK